MSVYDHIENFLKLVESRVGKRTFFIIKWSLLSLLGVAFLSWFAVTVIGNVINLGKMLNIQFIPSSTQIPTEIFPRMLFAILWTTLYFVILAGIALVIALPLTLFTAWVFSPFSTTRIDNIFAELLPIVKRNYELNPTDECKKVLDDTQKLFDRWDKSKLNKFIRRTTQKRTKEMWDRKKL